jgi:hypothetical protein
MNPPIIRWYPDAQSGSSVSEVSNWDAGVVDAGSYSRPEDPTISDGAVNPSLPSTFTIWNNRHDSALNPSGNSVAVLTAKNIKMTTLSLVRDGGGSIDISQSYLPSGPVAAAVEGSGSGQRQATVQVIFFDTTKKSGAGQWGGYNSSNEWVGWDPDEADPLKKWKIYNQAGTFLRQAGVNELGWRDIYGDTRAKAVVASGSYGSPESLVDSLSGEINTASISTNKSNYTRVRLRLRVHPLASAGKVEWFSRISYTYDTV